MSKQIFLSFNLALLCGQLNAAVIDASGVTVEVAYSSEVFSNVDGGFQSGTQFNGLLTTDIDLDLGALIGLSGGALHTTLFYYKGNDISADYVGDFGVVSNLITDTEFNVFTLYYEQAWADEAVTFKVGQLAVDDDFYASDVAALFLNANFGALPTASANVAAPIYSLAAPGAYFSWSDDEALLVRAGLYAGDAGRADNDVHGFEWRAGGAAGYTFFYEAVYDYAYNSKPGLLKLGGYYASGEFDDFNSGNTVDGNYAFYFVIEQALSMTDETAPQCTAFLRAGWNPQEARNTVHFYTDFGFNWQGPLSARSDDVFGVAVSIMNFGDDYIASENSQGNRVTGQEIVLETTYAALINEHWSIQPDIQYIWNPHVSRDNAFVLGLRSDFAF